MTKETRSQKAMLPFRAVLTKLMSERGLTPAQVATLAGVSRSVVGDWVNGATPRDLVAVGKLARALGVTLRELLLDEQEEAVPETTAFEADPLAAFDEQDFIDGVFRVRFQRLVHKKPKRGP